jgi:hypothetical protein
METQQPCHQSKPLDTITIELNPIHILMVCFLNFHFNNVSCPRSSRWQFSKKLPHRNLYAFTLLIIRLNDEAVNARKCRETTPKQTARITFQILPCSSHANEYFHFSRQFQPQEYNGDEPGISVSIMTGHGLDDRAIEVWSPAGAKDISCNLCVQNGSGTHPASCTMATGGPFPGAKVRPGRDADHSPLSSAEIESE